MIDKFDWVNKSISIICGCVHSLNRFHWIDVTLLRPHAAVGCLTERPLWSVPRRRTEFPSRRIFVCFSSEYRKYTAVSVIYDANVVVGVYVNPQTEDYLRNLLWKENFDTRNFSSRPALAAAFQATREGNNSQRKTLIFHLKLMTLNT